ncbi:CotH kinase family protein [Brachybacterium sp. SGAir0954]|uniref:CotH kinase family protein n=1 Tax=Brachybacterium sp. SGAir0954 TaxID=2571029 RepID=UPI0010F9544D|nr:CotH kinase family protein [Brachybacterium sp. SGAir0954]
MTTSLRRTTPAFLSTPSRRGFLALGGAAGVVLTAVACTRSSADDTALDGDVVTGAVDGDFWDMSTVHTMSVALDEDAYDEMIAAYQDDQTKNWIEADVEIDGSVFEKAGIKLKGNSSLRSLAGGGAGGGGMGGGAPGGGGDQASDGGGDQASDGGGDGMGAAGGDTEGDGTISADDPTGLPWVIRLDKYTDGQSFSGRTEFVVRGSNTETSLNEAVALDVLSEAGVPAEKYAFTRFSVNGADAKLRLVLDLPDDDLWNADAFDSTGATFKADSGGDYTYRGDTEEDYTDVFDAKFVGDDLTDEESFAALGSFLQFINESEDDEFASDLGSRLDVDGFATYLAVQELVQNSDDIDGPGNNSYLHYDPSAERWEVVAWDQNLSFGGMGGGGGRGGGGQGGGGQGGGGDMASDAGGDEATGGMPGGVPDGAQAPGRDGDTDAQGGGGGGGMGGSNILSERFLAESTFADLYEETLASVEEAVYTSGTASDRLETLIALLKAEASDLVDSADVDSDGEAISAVIES